jgi:hypothetical protein
VLLAIGLSARDRTRASLQRLVSRFGSGTVPRSIPVAILLMVAAASVAAVPFSIP